MGRGDVAQLGHVEEGTPPRSHVNLPPLGGNAIYIRNTLVADPIACLCHSTLDPPKGYAWCHSRADKSCGCCCYSCLSFGQKPANAAFDWNQATRAGQQPKDGAGTNRPQDEGGGTVKTELTPVAMGDL